MMSSFAGLMKTHEPKLNIRTISPSGLCRSPAWCCSSIVCLEAVLPRKKSYRASENYRGNKHYSSSH